ncbi:NAD(P)-binding protein [Flagelloscypha sp. PMI_526]|nr:NAD(P)-binding protein [Flagelloscypha sp. PMI_526]
MPSLSAVKASNASFSPNYVPVAIFLGGTAGIGAGAAKALAEATHGNAHIIIVGRNKEAAKKLIASFPQPTKQGADHEFIFCDATLMKNVSYLAKSLLARLDKVNFIFTSTAFVTSFSAHWTEEGLERNLALLFYARWKIVLDLLPLMEKAVEKGEDAKVLTVLAAGKHDTIDRDNLGLKKNFNLNTSVRSQLPAYTNRIMEYLANAHPKMSFIETAPGFVLTNLHHNAEAWYLKIFAVLLSVFGFFFATSWQDSGEYTLYGLLKSGPGAKWIGKRGEDLGSWEHNKEESELIMQHLKETTSL